MFTAFLLGVIVGTGVTFFCCLLWAMKAMHPHSVEAR